MASKNAPNPSRDIQEKEKQGLVNINLLFEQSFRDVCGTQEGQRKSNFELSPKKYEDIRSKKVKLQPLILNRAIYLKDLDDAYTSLSEKELEEFDMSEIEYQFQIFSRQLLVGREKLQRRLKSYPNLKSEEKNILESKFHSLTVNQISGLLDSRRSFEDYIESNLGIQPGTLSVKMEEIDEIFPQLQSRSPELFIQLRDHIALHGNLIDLPKLLLWQCFRLYQSSPKELKKIAKTFDLGLSLKDCVQYGIMKESFLENLAIGYVGSDVWNKLSEKHKKRYLNNMVHDDSLKISPNDIQNLEDLLENNPDMRNAIQSAFQKELDFMNEHGTDPIIGDLIPDTVHQGTDQEKYIWHRVWLEKIQHLLKQKGVSIDGIEKLREGAVLSFLDPNDRKTIHTIRIDKQDTEIDSIENGIEYTILTASQGVWTGSSEKNIVSYSEFGSMLLHMHEARVLSSYEFQEKIVTDLDQSTKDANLLTASKTDKIFDQGINTEGVITREKFFEEINTIHDPKGKDIPFEVGMSFISKSGEDGFEDREFSYEILSIDDSGIRVQGIDFLISFSQFLEIIQKQGFRRVGKITKDSDFVQALAGFGVDPHAEIKDGILVLDEHSGNHDDHHGEDHSHGSHDHHEESGPKKISYFTSKSGGHIKVFEMKNGTVRFGEWRGVIDIDKVQKANSAGKVSEKEMKKLYTKEPAMSYGMFLDYLKKNDYTASAVDLLQDPDASYHEAHFHMEETFLKRWMKNPSLADIFHGVSGVIHAAEHYFEKGSKLNGSRSALWLAKKFNLPADILAQLQADEIGNMKGIIEKIKDKLKGLNGPVARIKALHIVHMKGSRPEEIAAAALYMVESYGHLYAEDIAHAQGTESFLNALIYSCGYTTPEAIREQKIKARNKFRGDVGTEPGGQITEEEMIWGFLKGMDGNAKDNPLAGALVKAMGGPSGWERAWRTEGTKNAIEKGIRQTGDIPNAQGRMNKFLSAIATHEFHTAYGMMKNINGKDVSPTMQGAPVIWALCGITQYASTKLVQDNLFQFVASQGHSFHAYSFLRNKPQNDLYKDVFLSAMEGIADPSDIKSIRESIQAVQLDGHRDPKDADLSKKQLKHFQNINNIWRKYCDRGLHARLQGHDSWLVEQIHDHHNSQVEKYFGQIGDYHSMMSTTTAPSDGRGWEMQFGYKDSMILQKTKDGYLSLGWQINKISKAGSTSFTLNQDSFIRYWPPIIQAFENLRSSSLSPDIKRQQYLQFRHDILDHFRGLLNSFYKGNIDDVLRSLRSQPYSKDLLRMGITLEEIFSEEYSIHGGTAESDYQSWLQGGRILSTTQETKQVQKKTSDLLEKMKDNDSWARSKLKNVFGKTTSAPQKNDEFMEI